MPEHFDILITEPELGPPSTIMQVLRPAHELLLNQIQMLASLEMRAGDLLYGFLRCEPLFGFGEGSKDTN